MRARVWGAFLLAFLAVILFTASSAAAQQDKVCAVYFTGNGCPHCANVKPVIEDALAMYPGLVLIRYEIYDNPANAPVLNAYAEAYGAEAGIPWVLFSNDTSFQGDRDIMSKLHPFVKASTGNGCPLADGTSIPFDALNSSVLLGSPEILVGSNATQVDGTAVESKLTVFNVVALALADAVNPCVYAMVVLILLAILTRDPKNKKGALTAGFAFALAVFVLYFVYGSIIIVFFRAVSQWFGMVKPILITLVAVLAIVLGAINIRDFFSYRPGRLGSEMPIMFRPRVKKMIEKVTNAKGAFVVGAFVTLFLLPCTSGPYVILGSILSSMDFAAALPWLLFYNLIFVLPIIVLTLIVYFGFSTVERVSGWREENIKWLHLVEGILLLVVGVAMLLGWLS